MSDEDPPHSIAADVTIAVGADSAIPPPSLGPVTISDMTLAQEVLSNRWEILGMLGMGGMGTVYRARDRELEEVVALKLLRAEHVGPEGIDRFRREVKLARRVTHKNVARVHELGEHDGRRFFTMELVEGESLHQHIDRKGALPFKRVLEIGLAIARGLEAAHEVGVIHRDLKPDNVLMSRDGRVAVTDFGIASLTTEASATQTTSFVGTPLYMAPEQVDRSRALDARTDLYAFGAVLYEMVTGDVPFTGPTPLAIAVARLQQAAPDPRVRRSETPNALAELILACMARDPDHRPGSAADVARSLEELRGQLVPAASASQPSLPPPAPAPGATTISFPWSALTKSGTTRLALLPIWNGGAPEDAYLADGLSDDLIDGLATVRAVQVLSRSTVARFAGRSADPRQVGNELGADVVAEGSLRRAPDGRLRLSLRLINARDGLQLWSKRMDFADAEILEVSDLATREIATALTGTPQRESRKLSDPQAVDLYLRARTASRELSPAGAAQAVQYFDAALSFNPTDSLLLAGRATALARLSFFEGNRLEAAAEAAEQAVRMGPQSGESHLAKANVLLHENRVREALSSGLRAVSLAPSLGEAHHLVGRVVAEVGPLDLARRFLESAFALEPSSFIVTDLSRVIALQGHLDLALGMLKLDDPHLPNHISYHFVRARLAMWAGDEEAAKDSVRALSTVALDQSFRGGNTIRVLTIIFDMTRRFDLAVAETFADAEQRSIRRSLVLFQLMTEALCWRHDYESAETLIVRAVDSGLHDLVWLDRCPLLAPLRMRLVVPKCREVLVQRASAVRSVLPRSPGSLVMAS